MPVTKIKSKWVDGDLVFTNQTGTEIARFDESVPALNVATLALDGTVVTATAEQLNSVSAAITVANKSGGDFAAGLLVYLSGYDVTLAAPSVTVADATHRATHVLTEAILNNASGQADGEATVTGLNTLAGSVGDPVYLAAAGGFGFAALTGADELTQVVGIIVVDSDTVGSVFFFPGYGDVSVIGTSAIQDAAVTSAKLANGAGVAALLTAGLGGSNSVLKAETTTKTIVAADGAKDRACICLAIVDEEINDGTGTAPVITVGETDTLDKMWGAADFPSVTAAGVVIVGAFTNTATKAIAVDIAAAVGNGTGGVSVTVLSIPTT